MSAAPLILVADPEESCRKDIGALLRRIGFETAEATTGPETLEAATRLRPALVYLDVGLPEVSAYEVCRELRDDFGAEIAIILLSRERTTPADRGAGLLVGADDYIVKPFDNGEFLARARSVLRRVPLRVAPDPAPSPLGDSLTPRERQVLRLLAAGFGQSEIAGRLVISPKTVGGHIQRILTKLDVHSRAQAVAVAHENGLTDAGGGEVGAHAHAVLAQAAG